MHNNENLQRALRLCNYGNLEIDGIIGEKTENAIRYAQSAYGIEEDGIYGDLTHAYLEEEVRAIQVKLHMLGFYHGDIDCVVGDQSETAVKEFQDSVGIDADGLVGPFTRQHIALRCDYDEFATPNFSADEFKCQCGCGMDIHRPLKQKIQRVRDKIGLPFIITDGYRCPTRNAQEGGTSTSLHMQGRAVDFQVPYEHRSQDMIDRIADACHEEGLKVGYYYQTLFTHAQIGRDDYVEEYR